MKEKKGTTLDWGFRENAGHNGMVYGGGESGRHNKATPRSDNSRGKKTVNGNLDLLKILFKARAVESIQGKNCARDQRTTKDNRRIKNVMRGPQQAQ